ncbi:F-box associated domain containing protein [Tanacetum coccineum]
MIHEDCEPEDLRFVRMVKPGILKWLEIKGGVDDTRLHQDFVMIFDLGRAPTFQDSNILQVGSVNGLICLWKYAPNHDNIYICNPITREYMILPRLQNHTEKSYAAISYGFGVGLLTKEYKVIRIFQPIQAQNLASNQRHRLLEAEVYTLGTGRWRRLGHVPYWLNEFHGPFLNGCVHWIFCGRDSPKELYAFNFDKETFSFFPSPPSEEIQGDIRRQRLGVINSCLSMCITSSLEFTIWVMKEYGIRKSWHKEVMFTQSVKRDVDWWMGEPVTGLFGLKDGTILMFVHEHFLVYCPWQKTIEKRVVFGRVFTGIAYGPSLFKLQTFESVSACLLKVKDFLP